jgi:hypothetical protein
MVVRAIPSSDGRVRGPAGCCVDLSISLARRAGWLYLHEIAYPPPTLAPDSLPSS